MNDTERRPRGSDSRNGVSGEPGALPGIPTWRGASREGTAVSTVEYPLLTKLQIGATDKPSKGQVCELEPMLAEYYEARGWENGVVPEKKLKELGII